MNKVQKMMNKALDKMAKNIPLYTGSNSQWGEVELPDCLREELEARNQYGKRSRREKV